MFFFKKKRKDLKLYAYDDPEHRGRRLVRAARKIGIRSRLFNESSDVPNEPDVVAHIHVALVPRCLQKSISTANELLGKEKIFLIPRPHEVDLFLSKIKQTELYSRWMPPTWIIRSPGDAEKILSKLSFPFISKSDQSFQSCNVRLIKDPDMAKKEILQVFSPEGMDIAYGKQQHGYLYWQEFLPGNDGDWRVLMVANRYAYIIRRHNRPDAPFASGSGVHDDIEILNDEVSRVLDFAVDFAVRNKRSLAAIDIIKDGAGGLKLVEVHANLGWGKTSSCFFEHGEGGWSPTAYSGNELYDVMAKAIYDGDFA